MVLERARISPKLQSPQWNSRLEIANNLKRFWKVFNATWTERFGSAKFISDFWERKVCTTHSCHIGIAYWMGNAMIVLYRRVSSLARPNFSKKNQKRYDDWDCWPKSMGHSSFYPNLLSFFGDCLLEINKKHPKPSAWNGSVVEIQTLNPEDCNFHRPSVCYYSIAAFWS